MLEDIYPLSPLQKGLYFHWLNDPESQAYFSQMSCTVSGNLDLALLEKSYRQLISRYAVLRTFFTHMVSDEPLQVVKNSEDVCFEYKDVSQDEQLSLNAYKDADRKRGFNLQAGSQIRLTVLKTAEDQFQFIWSHHHILMDGWCVRILLKEFLEIYMALIQGHEPIPKKVYPYSDYIKWLDRQNTGLSLEYWRDYLCAYQQPTGIPVLASKNNNGFIKFREAPVPLEGHLRDAIKELCIAQNITENTFIKAIWSILLGSYNSTTDVVFGLVVSGRPPQLEGVEEMIGLFINTIPVRICMQEGQAFAGLLQEIHRDFTLSADHHYVQLADIQATSQAGNQLFDHILVFENYPEQEPAKQSPSGKNKSAAARPVVGISALETFQQTSYDFWLTVVPKNNVFTIKLNYNEALYDDQQITRLSGHLLKLIETVVEDPEAILSELEIISAEERLQLVKELPPPNIITRNTDVNYVMPGNETEEKLAEIWQSILGVSSIGIKDDFFAKGGHSIRAIQLLSYIQKAFNVNISLKDLFAYPLLEDQARLINHALSSLQSEKIEQ